ncbi:amine oxidase [flavin-containing] A isoform X2 [Ochlerotatus camptorhynchus]|uniref:amine oxidase [flavin-containing] A isoform X2 n=1 Tax=Ochlerotatus camptorhynchus TaxID=644619 RepID=UPI0031CE6967
MSDRDQIFDVLIVGAGLSGLCAAKRIRDKCSRDVILKVLEKSSRAGGQLDSFQSRWVTTSHFHAIELCRELGTELVELRQMVRVDPSLATTAERKLRDVSPFEGLIFGTLAKIETNRLMTEIDSLCATRFIIEDPLNMDVFLERKLLLDASKDFFRFVIKISCGFHPIELSVTDWLKFCRSMSSMSGIYEMLNRNLTHLVPKEGWNELVDQLVETIGEENITFSTKVTRVELTAEEDLVSVADENGCIWKARIVICAVPCDELQRIDFIPSRPTFFRMPNLNANITHVTSFKVWYESSIWRDHGYSGSLFLPSYRMLCFEREDGLLEGSFFHMDNLNEFEASQTGIFCRTTLKCHHLSDGGLYLLLPTPAAGTVGSSTDPYREE